MVSLFSLDREQINVAQKSFFPLCPRGRKRMRRMECLEPGGIHKSQRQSAVLGAGLEEQSEPTA